MATGAGYPDVLGAAWAAYGDPRVILAVNEVSAFVSTNHVYRLVLSDGSTCIAKVSTYGSYFLFREDHDRIHRWNALLHGTRFAGMLADSFSRADGSVFTYYDPEYGDHGVWAVFYDEVARRRSLPKILTPDQIDNLAEEIAAFHLLCSSLASGVPPASKTIRSDAIRLYDEVCDPYSAQRFHMRADQLRVVRRHAHEFLVALDQMGYDAWQKVPVLVDWNLGNFSVSTEANGRFRLFSRWDYDWFRIEPRHLDFYFFARVSSQTGDRTQFTYGAHPMLEPRFRRFLTRYHGVFPLTPVDVHFLKEAYRFFLLNYVIREGDAFFRPDLCAKLRRDVVDVHLPALDHVDMTPLEACLA